MKRPAQRRELAAQAVAHHGVSIALACRIFGISETCFRYRPRLAAENDRIAALLVGLTQAHRRWGFGLCFLYLRNVQGQLWNHKRVYRIYRELELNLRIKSAGAWFAKSPKSCRSSTSQRSLVHGFHDGQTFGWTCFSAPEHSG
ncbi:hypothetical protein [Acetobacter oryzifermentans]|uniref:hypothetical protein n=1 Tax=Acetobacter oryzifermentans TaxID=1633874 RepID=UPI0038D09D27